MSTQPPSHPLLPSSSPPIAPLVHRTPVEPAADLPVLSNRAMAWGAAALVVLGIGLAAGLLVAFGDGRHANQLDAVKTAGTIVLGTGGAAALWLTARRQRISELSLNQTRATHAATVADAEARRITDLYGKAADQLGSAQAAVRLAGLYALERLAQDNPGQRQTTVELLCAYLRMPHGPSKRAEPARRPAVSRPLLNNAARRRTSMRPAPRADPPTDPVAQEQEQQVRRTAQAILCRHLRPGPGPVAVDTFWPAVNLDLTGAVLGPANLIGCRVDSADFTGVTFTGDVWLRGARFGLGAVFSGARFAGVAGFSGARFDYDALFDGATFDRYARFDGASFGGTATFAQADFHSGAVFTEAEFTDEAWLHETRFAGQAEFDRARFARRGVFGRAIFADNAYFNDVEFNEGAGFHEARFTGAWTRFSRATIADADYRGVEFDSDTSFTEARFAGPSSFGSAVFAGGVEFARTRFDQRADFDHTRFTAPTAFDGAEFGGDARFHSTEFGRSPEFTQARFAGDVRFENTTFADGAGFIEAEFGGWARFLDTTFSGITGFPRARFAGETVFDRVRFDEPVGFVGTDFARPPRFARTWVRLDDRKPRAQSTWPPGMIVQETTSRPSDVHEGRWGLLLPAPPDEPISDAAG